MVQGMIRPSDMVFSTASVSGEPLPTKVYMATLSLLLTSVSSPASNAGLVTMRCPSVQTNTALRGARAWYSSWMSPATRAAAPAHIHLAVGLLMAASAV